MPVSLARLGLLWDGGGGASSQGVPPPPEPLMVPGGSPHGSCGADVRGSPLEHPRGGQPWVQGSGFTLERGWALSNAAQLQRHTHRPNPTQHKSFEGPGSNRCSFRGSGQASLVAGTWLPNRRRGELASFGISAGGEGKLHGRP